MRDSQIVFDASGGSAAQQQQRQEAAATAAAEEQDEQAKETGRMVIENALGYARQLETIV